MRAAIRAPRDAVVAHGVPAAALELPVEREGAREGGAAPPHEPLGAAAYVEVDHRRGEVRRRVVS